MACILSEARRKEVMYSSDLIKWQVDLYDFRVIESV